MEEEKRQIRSVPQGLHSSTYIPLKRVTMTPHKIPRLPLPAISHRSGTSNRRLDPVNRVCKAFSPGPRLATLQILIKIRPSFRQVRGEEKCPHTLVPKACLPRLQPHGQKDSFKEAMATGSILTERGSVRMGSSKRLWGFVQVQVSYWAMALSTLPAR